MATSDQEKQQPTTKPEAKEPFKAPKHDFETQVGGERGLEIEMGGTSKPVVKQDNEGITTDMDANQGVRTDDEEVAEEERKAAEEDKAAEGGAADEQSGGEAALPDFDAEKPEVVEAYNKRFLAEDGKGFNEASLGAEWAANIKKDAKGNPDLSTGQLSEGTYKWFESKGIPRSVVKSHEAGVLAQQQVAAVAIFERAGGVEPYQAALAWARKGGYSKEAAERFNSMINGTDKTARDEAVDLLVARYQKANPKGRDVNPKRSASSAGGGGAQGEAAQGYKDRGEWRAAYKAAREANEGRGDQKLLDESRRRLKASAWYKGGEK